MKVLYTSDLHGSNSMYQHLVKYIQKHSIQALILGGDLLPRKGLGVNSLEVQKNYVENNLRPYLYQIHEYAECAIYLILGNDDWAATLQMFGFLSDEGVIHVLHGTAHTIGEGMIISGYPYVPPTPFSSKDFEKIDKKDDPLPDQPAHSRISTDNTIRSIDLSTFLQSRTTIEQDMKQFRSKAAHQTIYVIHAPPYDTYLDMLHDGRHIGSRAIRDYIDTQQPYMTLHGHIHESPGMSGFYWQKIGSTLSINPGQSGDQLSAVSFDLKNPIETLNHTLYGKAIQKGFQQ